MAYHKPVLLKESIEALNIRPDGIYVDLTFGGGGHAIAILENVKEGRLFAFDQDQDAEENAKRLNSRSFTFIRANFRYFDKYLKLHGISEVDGILADLGVSSHQIDSPERGFSTRFDADLDMRMDKNIGKNARVVLNKSTEEELHKIFGMYGEVKNAKTLAKAVVKARQYTQLNSIDDLKLILKDLAPKGKENKYYAQVFQALRIVVNQEIDALKEMLERSVNVLKPGGRIAVISYHSLEDRLVKNFFNKGKFYGELEKDVYGNIQRPLDPLFRKPVSPSEEEVEMNSRSRSAKLRVAVKIS